MSSGLRGNHRKTYRLLHTQVTRVSCLCFLCYYIICDHGPFDAVVWYLWGMLPVISKECAFVILRNVSMFTAINLWLLNHIILCSGISSTSGYWDDWLDSLPHFVKWCNACIPKKLWLTVMICEDTIFLLVNKKHLTIFNVFPGVVFSPNATICTMLLILIICIKWSETVPHSSARGRGSLLLFMLWPEYVSREQLEPCDETNYFWSI